MTTYILDEAERIVTRRSQIDDYRGMLAVFVLRVSLLLYLAALVAFAWWLS